MRAKSGDDAARVKAQVSHFPGKFLSGKVVVDFRLKYDCGRHIRRRRAGPLWRAWPHPPSIGHVRDVGSHRVTPMLVGPWPSRNFPPTSLREPLAGAARLDS